MRIAVIGSRGLPARWGGYERVAEELATRLAARGHDVTVYCRGTYSDKKRPRIYRGVRLVYLPHLSGKSLESPTHEAISSLHALLRPFDIYLILGCRASWCYLPHRVVGKNVIFQTDGLDWERQKWGFLARQYLKFCYWVAVRMGANLVSDSRAVCDFFSRKYGRRPAYLSYGANAVSSADPSTLREYGLEPQGYFLAVCRLEPENNAEIMIHAFTRVRTTKKLAVVGGVNYASPYVRRLHRTKDPRVVFLGPVYKPGHLDALRRYCYAYVHGHEVGGTSPALLEAMAAGCCILALRVPFNGEVLDGAGVFWDKSPAALAREMENALADPEAVRQRGVLASRRVQAVYDWETAVDAHEQYFQRLVSKGRAERNRILD